MATWTVGSTGDFPSIQDANDSLGVQPGDFINLLANYSGETATITKEHLTINGDATNSNIALNFDQTTLTLTGLAPIDVTAAASPNDVTLTGNGGANALIGGGGDDHLSGGAGNDAISGGNGDDTLDGGSGNDTLVGEAGDDALSGGSGNDHIDGGADVDVLSGGGGDDVLIGGAGSNTLDGGSGSDTADYSAAPAAIVALSNTGTVTGGFGGVDTLIGIENFVGSAFNDTLVGNASDNVLDGRAGADSMSGGAGNDTYHVDTLADVVTESANGGTDTVFASINYNLSLFLENLTLTGGANLQGYGNASVNVLTGNSGDNLLNGMGGADLMQGGAGNDVYFVDNIGDSVVENANEGNDSVFASVNFTLSANVENLILQGSADLQGFGNGGANVLYGNTGNNLLDGGAGIDLMVGGAGNDTYYVDDPSDSAFELANEGNDAVFASCHYGLAADVETLVMQGSGDFQGYGNNQVNTLLGNAGNNLLNGAGGADTMQGGGGDDTYFVDDVFDTVIENANEGTDAVFAFVSYTLTANVEALVLQGSNNVNGTGNALANSLFGNSGDNTLDGGAAADSLTGDAGNDTFVFKAGEANGDMIVDFAGNGAAAGDSLQFVGYGPGATFTNIDPTHWQVNYNGGSSHDIITFANAASIDATDFIFL
jgi:Ca2+-binding RTX toxin-like protein